MKKVLLTLVIGMFWTIPLAYGQLASGCAVCIQRLHSDPPTCGHCPGPAACGCDIDVLLGGQYYSCVPCGCCNYIPGTGGVCYDSTGGACNNENCSDKTAPTNTSVKLKDDIHLIAVQKAKEGPVSWSTLSAAQLIEESPWLADEDFPQKIRGLAPYLSDLVLSLQDQLKRRNHLPAREGRTIGGYIYFRDDYPAHFTVMKAGNVWRLELSPDPKNPDAPNIVEILGRNWRLVHHVHPEPSEKVFARGTY